jgi:hypothetical protein
MGRPPGKPHPLPFKDFWILVLEQLPEVELMHLAYLAAELIVEDRYGRRRFKSYQSFRSVKCRWLKTKSPSNI